MTAASVCGFVLSFFVKYELKTDISLTRVNVCFYIETFEESDYDTRITWKMRELE